jgi:hypothetical protein
LTEMAGTNQEQNRACPGLAAAVAHDLALLTA